MGLEVPRPIPFTVVGGYLGSGKTTLINGLLAAGSGRRIAVLVNDFGALNIDAQLIERSDGETLELANGCICCSLAGGFAAALGSVLGRPVPPERIVVEASGIADPWRIAQIGLTPGFILDGIVVMADAETVRSRAGERYVGDVVRGQLSAADLVVLNRTDLVDAEERDRTVAWLRELVPDARLLETTFGAVPPEVLLGADRPQTVDRPEAPSGHDHLHESAFASTVLSADEPLDRAALGAFLAGMPPEIYRAKGLVDLADDAERRTVLQLVGRRWSLTPGAPWRDDSPASHVVVIGAAASLAAADLSHQFALCSANVDREVAR